MCWCAWKAATGRSAPAAARIAWAAAWALLLLGTTVSCRRSVTQSAHRPAPCNQTRKGQYLRKEAAALVAVMVRPHGSARLL